MASLAPCLISAQDPPLPPEMNTPDGTTSTRLVFVTAGPPNTVIPLPGNSETSLTIVPGSDDPNESSFQATHTAAPDQSNPTSELSNEPSSEVPDQPSQDQPPTTTRGGINTGTEDTAMPPSTDLPTAPIDTTALPTEGIPTSVSDGGVASSAGDETVATDSGVPGTKSPSETDDSISSAATSAGQDETSSPIDKETQPVASQSQAPSVGGNSGMTSATQDVPPPSQVTSDAADPKSTAEGDAPPVTPAPDTKTDSEGQQATITGSDGEVVTWSATQDPEHTDVTNTQTQTDDDGAIIVIFPGGWKWTPVGGKGGPLPTIDPKPVNNDNDDNNQDDDDDNDDDDDDDDEEECTTTAPPKCTLTMSYYTREDGEGTSTRIGTCPPVTGCVSGEQSTTTTTVASDVPRITGIPEGDVDFGREDLDAGPMEEETVKYFSEMFKKWGISSNATEDDEKPKSSCDRYSYGASADCLELFSTSFCDSVEENNEALSKNLTYQDVAGDEKRAIATGAERRSLQSREIKCSSHTFNFEWTGADGACDLSCSKAFSQLQTSCFRPFWFPGLAAKGSVDVGCGTYSYQVSREPTTTTTTTTTEAQTTTEQPKPTATQAKLEMHNLQCNNEDDFKGHADIAHYSVGMVLLGACQEADEKQWTITPDSEPRVKEYKDRDTHKHRITWSWLDGCTMENKNAKLVDPLNEGTLDIAGGSSRCEYALASAWANCVNGGVGGSIDVGCVRYFIESGI
ncbi:hypothetical protein FBEOM_4273 [Fusarium beomiforme]|uniref:Uncharacterized protein n=1 Tax=Fusarium beomiforme TaxID=44412 RepID=A0A9P5DYE6_9HYPO|nr:hypothetical protein FBEOM_4273 [Fusarium beomiforme]